MVVPLTKIGEAQGRRVGLFDQEFCPCRVKCGVPGRPRRRAWSGHQYQSLGFQGEVQAGVINSEP